jgi:hypothetical protein
MFKFFKLCIIESKSSSNILKTRKNNPICDLDTLQKKTKYRNEVIFLTIIFGELSVLMPLKGLLSYHLLYLDPP